MYHTLAVTCREVADGRSIGTECMGIVQIGIGILDAVVVRIVLQRQFEPTVFVFVYRLASLVKDDE